jgi:MFS family permease
MMERRGLHQLVGSLFLLQLGAMMTYVALPLLMAERYGLGLETGIALGLQLLPSLLLAGPVAVLIRRADPRRVAILSAFASAGVVVLFPASTSLFQVNLLAIATGVTFAFGIPARMALRPRVMAAGEVVRGNGLLVAGDRLATVLGPGLAGPLIALGSIDWLFYAEAVTAAGAAVFLLGLGGSRSDIEDEDGEPIGAVPPINGGAWLRTLFVEPIDGFRGMLREHPTVAALTLTALGYVAAVGASRLLLTEQSPTLFDGDTAALGYLVAAMAAGGVIGAVVGGRLGRFKQGRLFIAGNVCEALCWPLIPLVGHEYLALAVMFLAGVFESLPTVVYFAEVQARLSPTAVGAYYAWLLPLTQTCNVLGAVGGGLLLTTAGAIPLSVVMACVIGGPVVALAPTLLRIAGERRRARGSHDRYHAAGRRR